MELNFRRENRLLINDEYSKSITANKELPINSNILFQNKLQNLFAKLFAEKSTFDEISDCLIILNNSFRLSSELLIRYISIEEIQKIFSLAFIQPYICCSVYKFFTSLMKRNPKKYYSLFQKSNIYQATVDIINPTLDHFIYNQILCFICATMIHTQESIVHLIECCIIDHLKLMDQNENVDQLLIIYSNIIMICENNDYSYFSKVFDYLAKGRITTIFSALYYIDKCLQKHENDYVWKYAISDTRLAFLLDLFDPHIIAGAIHCYGTIASYGDEAISMFLNNRTLLTKILNLIQNELSSISQSCNDSHVAVLESLNFVYSMIEHTSNDEILSQIIQIIEEFNFKNTIKLFKFVCKEKICLISLSLLNKISISQFNDFFNEDFLDDIGQVLIGTENNLDLLCFSLKMAKEKFSLDENIVNLLDDILCKYCYEFI